MKPSQRWITGVDEPLPEGEEILWRSSPTARAVALHVLHLRVWGAYLAALTVIVALSAFGSYPLADVARLVVLPLLLAAFVLGGVLWLSRLTARTTEYIITSRRIVLRVGIAVPITINIPFNVIDEAGCKVFRDGSGEVRLLLSDQVKLAYIALWPHVDSLRHLANPRPKLRGLPDPERVGVVLRDAIAADATRAGATIRLGPTVSDETVGSRIDAVHVHAGRAMAR